MLRRAFLQAVALLPGVRRPSAPAEVSHLYDWSEGTTTDPAWADRPLPYGAVNRIWFNGVEVPCEGHGAHITRLVTGPRGWYEYIVCRPKPDGKCHHVYELYDHWENRLLGEVETSRVQFQFHRPAWRTYTTRHDGPDGTFHLVTHVEPFAEPRYEERLKKERVCGQVRWEYDASREAPVHPLLREPAGSRVVNLTPVQWDLFGQPVAWEDRG